MFGTFRTYKNGDSSSLTFGHRFGPQIVSGIVVAIAAPILFGATNSNILEGFQNPGKPIKVSCDERGAAIKAEDFIKMAWFSSLSLQDVCGEMDANGSTDVYWDEGDGN